VTEITARVASHERPEVCGTALFCEAQYARSGYIANRRLIAPGLLLNRDNVQWKVLQAAVGHDEQALAYQALGCNRLNQVKQDWLLPTQIHEVRLPLAHITAIRGSQVRNLAGDMYSADMTIAKHIGCEPFVLHGQVDEDRGNVTQLGEQS
jgi:hypothetical protein